MYLLYSVIENINSIVYITLIMINYFVFNKVLNTIVTDRQTVRLKYTGTSIIYIVPTTFSDVNRLHSVN